MKAVLNALLNSEHERRTLSYTERGTPIIWDLPFYGDKNETEAAIRVLEHPDVVAALKKGLLLPEAQVFIWVSRDGELDYGLVQGTYFITLWVTSMWKKVKNLPLQLQPIVAAEEIYQLAQDKFHRERAYKEEVIRDLSGPWLPPSILKEKKKLLEVLEKNLHPLWKDLKDKVQVLLSLA